MSRYSSVSCEQLIQVCGDSDDADAWEEFVSRFQRSITLSVIRTTHPWNDTPRQVIDDLVQDTYLKLCADRCRLLRDFAAKHPDAIPAYIRTVAINVVHDHFKAHYSQKRGAGKVHESLDDVHPQAGSQRTGGENAMERVILLKQIDECLTACAVGPDQERDRLIFWLYYQQGMSAKAIAALPAIGLTAKGVESAIFRLTGLVREQMVSLRPDAVEETGSRQKGFRPAESY